MDVRSFDGSRDAALWDAYVTSHPEATSDHLWGWRRVLADSFGFREAEYLGAVEEGRLVGVLPLYRIPAGWRRSALTSIPFGNYGGICADSPAAVEALLDEARRRLDRCRGVHLELRHRQPIAQPLLHQSTGTHSRFILPLGSDPDVHLRQVGWKNRQKINRAIRLGLQVESALDVGRLYPIHMHTARRQGVPCFPRRYFEGILREFGERVRILLILHQGRAVSFSLYLLFGDTMLSQFSGSYAEAYTYNPNELLFWAAIQQGCALGMKTFDFGCSRIVSGTADFKRKLGFHEEPQTYQYRYRTQSLHHGSGAARERLNPDVDTATNEHHPWLGLARRAWRRLPMTITRICGPVVLRYFA